MKISPAFLKQVSEMNQDEFLGLIHSLNRAYEEGDPLTSDREYNQLEDIYLKRFGGVMPVGHRHQEGKALAGSRVRNMPLPYYVGGTEKAKTLAEFEAWVDKNQTPALVTAKLDGVAAIYVKTGKQESLLTRGDGVYGTDISHLLQYLNLPEVQDDLVVRGEIVIPLADFEPFRGERQDKGKYTTPRTMISGLIHNQQVSTDILELLHFVAFEIMSSSDAPTEQLFELENLGFEVVDHNDYLADVEPAEDYEYFLERTEYDIDGLVYYGNEKPLSIPGRSTSGIVAYKFDLDSTATRVTSIRWKASANGEFIPVVIFDPVTIDGSTITAASASNYGFLLNLGASVGSTVEVIKSGKTIPSLARVVESGTGDYNLPEGSTVVGAKLMASQEDSGTKISLLSGFVKKMNMKGVGAAAVGKMVAAGYDSISSLYKADRREITSVVGDHVGGLLYDALHRDYAVDLIDFIKASNIFPRLSGAFITKAMTFISDRAGPVIGADDMLTTIVEKSKSAEKWNENVPKLIDLMAKVKPYAKFIFGSKPVEV